MDENFIKVIDELLKKNNKVTFRPHPEHIKRSKKRCSFSLKYR